MCVCVYVWECAHRHTSFHASHTRNYFMKSWSTTRASRPTQVQSTQNVTTHSPSSTHTKASEQNGPPRRRIIRWQCIGLGRCKAQPRAWCGSSSCQTIAEWVFQHSRVWSGILCTENGIGVNSMYSICMLVMVVVCLVRGLLFVNFGEWTSAAKHIELHQCVNSGHELRRTCWGRWGHTRTRWGEKLDVRLVKMHLNCAIVVTKWGSFRNWGVFVCIHHLCETVAENWVSERPFALFLVMTIIYEHF